MKKRIRQKAVNLDPQISAMEENRQIYLKMGDKVFHKRYPHWGVGTVVEERNSLVLGGISYVKIIFRDGRTRVFDNNFANACCCYYAGIRRCF